MSSAVRSPTEQRICVQSVGPQLLVSWSQSKGPEACLLLLMSSFSPEEYPELEDELKLVFELEDDEEEYVVDEEEEECDDPPPLLE